MKIPLHRLTCVCLSVQYCSHSHNLLSHLACLCARYVQLEHPGHSRKGTEEPPAPDPLWTVGINMRRESNELAEDGALTEQRKIAVVVLDSIMIHPTKSLSIHNDDYTDV